jgi:hypothetical protein
VWGRRYHNDQPVALATSEPDWRAHRSSIRP